MYVATTNIVTEGTTLQLSATSQSIARIGCVVVCLGNNLGQKYVVPGVPFLQRLNKSC